MDFAYHIPDIQDGGRRCDVEGCNLLIDEHAESPTVWSASLDTRSFSFEALGLTEADAREALLDGLLAHERQYAGRVQAGWFDADDIVVREIALGVATRDREPLA